MQLLILEVQALLYSEACFKRLGLVEDKEVEFTILLATQTAKKKKKANHETSGEGW